MKPLSAIEESLALSEWAVARCWFCLPSQAWFSPWCCVAAGAMSPDDLVRLLSSKGLLRTVSR